MGQHMHLELTSHFADVFAVETLIVLHVTVSFDMRIELVFCIKFQTTKITIERWSRTFASMFSHVNLWWDSTKNETKKKKNREHHSIDVVSRSERQVFTRKYLGPENFSWQIWHVCVAVVFALLIHWETRVAFSNFVEARYYIKMANLWVTGLALCNGWTDGLYANWVFNFLMISSMVAGVMFAQFVVRWSSVVWDTSSAHVDNGSSHSIFMVWCVHTNSRLIDSALWKASS